MPHPTEELAGHAQNYAAIGWHVFPVAPHSKRPYAGSHGLHDSTADPLRVTALWAGHPGASIGVDCGRSGLVAIDIDGADGETTLGELVAVHGPLPATVEALTPGGGRHLLFQHPGGYIPSRTEVWPSIDSRANGGYIVVAPSSHPSGREYRWMAGRAPFDRPPSILPEWTLTALNPSLNRSLTRHSGKVITRVKLAPVDDTRLARLNVLMDRFRAVAR